MTLRISYDLGSDCVRLPNFGLGGNISSPWHSGLTDGYIQRTDKERINNPEWSFDYNRGIPDHFKRHNGFNDQERYARMTRNFVMRQGTLVKYYTSSFDPYEDSLYHEDNNRKVERYFDLPIILSFQPENEIYNRFGIQHMDEFEVHVHMNLFLELNYASLKKACVMPACPPTEHNPIWSQRGYEGFRYYGYTYAQIAPKQGDYLKVEAFNTLYAVESIKDAAPEYQHRSRKYWWKAFLKPATDNGTLVTQEVAQDPEQHGFIQQILGKNTFDPIDLVTGNAVPMSTGPSFPGDMSCSTNTLKKDILYRSPSVPQCAPDISKDPNWYPCGDKFGEW
jgi:hypothetical protein